MIIVILKMVILKNDSYFVYVYRYRKRYFIMDYAKVALEKHCLLYTSVKDSNSSFLFYNDIMFRLKSKVTALLRVKM